MDLAKRKDVVSVVVFIYIYLHVHTMFQSHSTGFQFYSCPIPADSCGFLWIPEDSGAIPEDSCRNGRGTVKY